MKIRQILDEIVWQEQYSALKSAARFPRGWIHFSNIAKLGINPSKTHRDPPGIYFYPCRWLLDPEKTSLSQYAISMPYYFVCRIAPSQNSIVLSRMTQAQGRKIAQRNGWLEDLDRAVQSGVLRNRDNPMDPKLLRRPGGAFYAAMDYLVNVEKKYQWLQLLRGVDALFDLGAGMISPNEVHQACIINKRLITVLDHGQNKDQWDQVHAKIMQQLAQEFGGKFYYKHKIPTVEVEIDGKPIKLEFDAGNWRMFLEYYKNGHWVREQERYYDPSTGDFESVLRTLRYQLKHAAEQATPGGITTSWTPERILGLFQTLMPVSRRLFRTIRKDNGSVTYGASWESGIITSAIYADIEQADALHLRCFMAISHEELAKVDTMLPANTDIRAAAAQVLQQLSQQAHANRPTMKWDDPKLNDHLKFNLPH